MAPQTTHVFLPDELQDVEKTSGLAAPDRDALRAVSEWIKDFAAKPHMQADSGGNAHPTPSRKPNGGFERSLQQQL
jgi:hypothetical protein